jgi:hypothetical protein
MIKDEFIIAIKALLKHQPEWSKDKALILLAGRETLFEYNPANGVLKIKKGRCTGCGECCLALIPNSTADIHWGTDDEGRCNKLYKDGDKWRCGAGMDQPYRCFPDPHTNTPNCEMTFHVEEIE